MAEANSTAGDDPRTDEQLLAAWLAGQDSAAFREFYERRLEPLREALRRRWGETIASAAYHHVLLKLLNGEYRASGTTGCLKGWLSIVAYHAACSEWERSKKERKAQRTIDDTLIDKKSDSPVESLVKAEEFASNDEEFALMRTAINELDPKLKIVVTLKYYRELSNEEIAKSVNISAGAVLMRLCRAREKLRNLLKDGSLNGPDATPL